MTMKIKAILLLAIVAFYFFEFILHRQSRIFRELEMALLQTQWMLLACMAVWCGSFIFLTFSPKDLPLIGLLLIAIAAFFIGYAAQSVDAVILLAGVTLGRGTRFFLKSGKRNPPSPGFGAARAESGNDSAHVTRHSSLVTFLVGLVVLLAFASWWHLAPTGAYHGPRWMGLWDNPNIYGMLMGVGTVLAIGLLAARKAESGKRKAEIILLLVAAVMLAVGLFFSYSRGALVGAAVGLLYLARASGKAESGKRKAKIIWYLVPIVVIASVAVVIFFWHNTADTDAWYLKRLDLSRPSAQHRVSAWRGALQMMRDHPLGVGWNKAVGVYEKNYSPPENGAAALTMNSYLMLGTELGIPGLVCFVAYVWLCFRRSSPHLTLTLSPPAAGSGEGIVMSPATCHLSLQTACRAGALMLAVAFWFDGGLFTLATASVFWILLELGANVEGRMKNVETGQSLVTSAPTKPSD
jgi:O-antigen ligase